MISESTASRRTGGTSKQGSRAAGRCGLAQLAAELERLGIIVDVGEFGSRSVRRRGRQPSSHLHIGAGELARLAAQFARAYTYTAIFQRIFQEVDRKRNRRLVMARCRDFSKHFCERSGFSALRLYNAYFKARRLRGRKDKR